VHTAVVATVERAPMSEHRRLRDAHIHDHFGTLFALLVTVFIISGFSDFAWARTVAGALQIVMLFVAYFSTRQKGRFPVVLVLVVLGIIAIVITAAVEEDVEQAHGVAWLCGSVMFLGLLIAVARRVLTQKQVTTETLLGALSVYFLVGLMFASLFAAIDSFSVEPIFGFPVPNQDYSYFSFITLTTVGYGDLTAVTDVARRFAVVEAMAGQIFLATAVARLVSLYGVSMRMNKAEVAGLAAAADEVQNAAARATAAVHELGAERDPSDGTVETPDSSASAAGIDARPSSSAGGAATTDLP